MTLVTRPRTLSLAVLSALALAAAGCSDGGGTQVAVTGTNDGCEVAKDEIQAGEITFNFTNEASQVSELYVLKPNGDIVNEVENVVNGTERELEVNLSAGDYTLRCRPGQSGKGFSTDITVTGEGGAAEAKPDRTVTFEAIDFDYERLDVGRVKEGDTIRFEMTNDGKQPHEFEVLAPDGDAVGEIAEVAPGERGGATITFTEPGTYTYQCILVDSATEKKHTMLGMKGTIEVAS